MKYAFLGTGGDDGEPRHGYSAVGSTIAARRAELPGRQRRRRHGRFFWSTEVDPPRPIDDLCEITDAHIRAIQPPRNERGWLDPTGWMGVYASRTIATELQVV
jgi:hypothetical protein